MLRRHHYRRRSADTPELDMTTFLNLMVVLVPFLLIGAVFSRMTIVELDLPSSAVAGSTDMGNVSYAVPAIHPMIKVAPEGTAIHTPDFATHARSEAGDRAVIDGALSMALTIVDLWANTETMGSVRGAFEESK